MALPLSFYRRGASEVAPDLLGKVLEMEQDGVVRRARIVETEAYVGTMDLASHASKGRTPRNESMWGPPGRAYVYLVYGIFWMFNVVCARDGDPQAVLVRAAEPLDGWQARLNGPGLLARSFGITREHDGTDLRKGRIRITAGDPPGAIATDVRVGVDYAGAWAKAPLRFLDPVSTSVSVPVRSVARARHRAAHHSAR